MTDYLCHEEPDLFEFEAEVVDARPGGVLLDRSAFYPGGGGQLPDRSWLRWGNEVVPVTHIEYETGRFAWLRSLAWIGKAAAEHISTIQLTRDRSES